MSTRRWKWSNAQLDRWAPKYHPEDPHGAIIDACRAAGMAGIEGHTTCFGSQSMAELEAIARCYAEAGLAVATFHLPYNDQGQDIASFYESVRRGAVDTALKWMQRAAALGAKVVIQHPTLNRCSVDIEGVDPYLRALEKSLGTLLPAAESLGITLAIENMLPGDDGGRFGSRPEHFQRMLEAFDHPSLGFCLDTGHALVSCHDKAPDMFEAMAPKLAAFHLVDNSGDRDSHLAPGHGRVDWDKVFQGMARIGFTGTACIEAPPFAFGPNYTHAHYREMIDTINALAEKALSQPVEASN